MELFELLVFHEVFILAFVINMLRVFLFTAVGFRQQKKRRDMEMHIKGGGLVGANIPNARVHKSLCFLCSG